MNILLFIYFVIIMSISWIKQNSIFNTASQEYYPVVACDSIGNIFIAYATSGSTSGNSNIGSIDIVVMKMNSSGVVQWIKQNNIINTTAADTLPAIACDSSGNIIVGYQTSGTTSGNLNVGGSDIIVFKIDTDGIVLWITQNNILDTTGTDVNVSIITDNSNNIYISYDTTGTTSGNSNIGSSDIVIVKMSSTGTITWIKQNNIFNTSGIDSIPKIICDGDGNLIVSYISTGTTSGNSNTGNKDVVILKMDTSGVVLWIKQNNIINTTNWNDMPSITYDSNNNIYLTYNTYGDTSGNTNQQTDTTLDIVIIKLNTNGIVEWIKQNSIFNTIDDEIYSVITCDRFDNIYIGYITQNETSGNTNPGGSPSNDIVIIKMNTEGDIIWIKQNNIFNSSESEESPSLTCDRNGNLYVVYTSLGNTSDNTNQGGRDVVVMKIAGDIIPPNSELIKSIKASLDKESIQLYLQYILLKYKSKYILTTITDNLTLLLTFNKLITLI